MVLRASEAILEKNLGILQWNKARLEEFVFSWVVPRDCAIVCLRFVGPMSSADLGDNMDEAAGILIKPAYCFDSVVVEDRHYFHVGFGEDITFEALEAL